MKVELNIIKGHCVVTKEKTDTKKYRYGYAEPESTFLYDVLQCLKSQGLDVIKKRMWKDGHMMSDTQQYIRSRKKTDDMIMIYNANYAIEDAGIKFNKMKSGESYILQLS